MKKVGPIQVLGATLVFWAAMLLAPLLWRFVCFLDAMNWMGGEWNIFVGNLFAVPVGVFTAAELASSIAPPKQSLTVTINAVVAAVLVAVLVVLNALARGWMQVAGQVIAIIGLAIIVVNGCKEHRLPQ